MYGTQRPIPHPGRRLLLAESADGAGIFDAFRAWPWHDPWFARQKHACEDECILWVKSVELVNIAHVGEGECPKSAEPATGSDIAMLN
jgi:hypothetical protein